MKTPVQKNSAAPLPAPRRRPPASAGARAKAAVPALSPGPISALAAAALFLVAGSLAAQEGPLSFSPVAVSWTFEARHPACLQKAVFTGTISFPRETGGRETDLKIASMAEEWLQETKARAMADIAASPNPCGPEEGKGMYTEIAYELFRPSPGLMGVLFTDRGHDGGARGWLGYTAYTFDLATGRILAPFDLFPDRPVAYAGLWAFVWNESCAKDPPRETLPRFYGGAACSGKAPPPPPDGFMEDAEELEDLGSLVLTEKGAALNIDPSSAWSWAEGPYRLEIPRTELVKWGANPDLWNGRKPADPTSPAAGGAPAAPAAEGPQASPASEGAPGAGTPALRADRPAGVTPSPAEGPAAAAPPLQPAASEGPASGGDAEPAPGTPGGARPGVPPVRPGG